MPNNLTQMAKDILQIESDLPYRFNYKDYPQEHPTVNDFDIYIFQQIWGSTALGFGGIGGQAMTSAYTYVFIPVNSSSCAFRNFRPCFNHQCIHWNYCRYCIFFVIIWLCTYYSRGTRSCLFKRIGV